MTGPMKMIKSQSILGKTMRREKTKKISSWEELVGFVENINPFKSTILLTGFINKLDGNKTTIDSLIFSTRPVEILKDDKRDK